MKTIIEQIKKIGGVITVEPAGENMAVVVFEAGKSDILCDTFDQQKFLKGIGAKGIMSRFFDQKIISFSDYISQNNLKSEWEKWLINQATRRGFKKGITHGGYTDQCQYEITGEIYLNSIGLSSQGDAGLIYCTQDGKWATIIPEEKPTSLKPEELVDGEIYIFDDVHSHVFRYANRNIQNNGDGRFISLYSHLYDDGSFRYGSICLGIDKGIILPATISEKQTLIRAEIANRYFYNLK